MSEAKDELKKRSIGLGYVVVMVTLALVVGFIIGQGVG